MSRVIVQRTMFICTLASIVGFLLAIVLQALTVRYYQTYMSYLKLLGSVYTSAYLGMMTFCSMFCFVTHASGVFHCWSHTFLVRRNPGRYFMIYRAMLPLLFLIILLSVILNSQCLGELTYGFQEGFRTAMNSYYTNMQTRYLINELQRRFECCGSTNYKDWFYIPWHGDALRVMTSRKLGYILNTSSILYGQGTPFSCCNPEVLGPCVHENMFNKYLLPSSKSEIIFSIYQEGCFGSFINRSRKFLTISVVIILTSQMVLCIVIGLSVFLVTSNKFIIIGEGKATKVPKIEDLFNELRDKIKLTSESSLISEISSAVQFIRNKFDSIGNRRRSRRTEITPRTPSETDISQQLPRPISPLHSPTTSVQKTSETRDERNVAENNMHNNYSESSNSPPIYSSDEDCNLIVDTDLHNSSNSMSMRYLDNNIVKNNICNSSEKSKSDTLVVNTESCQSSEPHNKIISSPIPNKRITIIKDSKSLTNQNMNNILTTNSIGDFSREGNEKDKKESNFTSYLNANSCTTNSCSIQLKTPTIESSQHSNYILSKDHAISKSLYEDNVLLVQGSEEDILKNYYGYRRNIPKPNNPPHFKQLNSFMIA